MPINTFFYLGLSFLIVHEMDAVRCKEWRILPILSLLNDKIGFTVFILAHVPLLYIIFWQCQSIPNSRSFIQGFDIFMIIHMGLHILLLKHKHNEFIEPISWFIIIGAGVCGLIDFVHKYLF
jgi:hypothetical protein